MAKGPPDASPASETAARNASRQHWKTENRETGRRSPRPQPRNRRAPGGAIPDADKILSKLRGDVKTKREHLVLRRWSVLRPGIQFRRYPPQRARGPAISCT